MDVSASSALCTCFLPHMDATMFPTCPETLQNQAAQSVPVIVLDSDSDENGLQSEGPPSREGCHTPPLQEIHPPNTANGDIVPETQQDSALWPTSVETPKASMRSFENN